MINRRGFLASALALGVAVALPLAPRPVRRWIASARARWARRRMWGCLTSDAEIARMVARGFPARIEDIPGALASNGAQPSTDYEQLRIADRVRFDADTQTMRNSILRLQRRLNAAGLPSD